MKNSPIVFCLSSQCNEQINVTVMRLRRLRIVFVLRNVLSWRKFSWLFSVNPDVYLENATMCIDNSSHIHISRFSARLIRRSTTCVVETVSLIFQKHQAKYVW